MDDFNNFFDNQSDPQPVRTPIYHTPEPTEKRPKTNVVTIISVIIAVLMTLVVIVNVIVLATLKDSIAKEYAESLAQQTYDQYVKAMQDVLDDSSLSEDIKNSATQSAIDAIKASVGEVAYAHSPSVARIYMSQSGNVNSSSAMATAFLITDADANNPQRYLITNAHCARYAAKRTVGGLWTGYTESYWASYGKIVAIFDGEDEAYQLEIVAYGSYTEDGLSPENDQPDLALLRVTSGEQPSNEDHPSLKIAAADYTLPGAPIALVGNPEGIGDVNSISTGCVSQTGIVIDSWGAGKFILTDAALNSGNSGGPMLNKLGVVVGVAESKLIEESIDNMGFALSAATLRSFLNWASQSANNTLKQALTINCTYV